MSKDKTRWQRQTRRNGYVKRVEFVLSADNPRDRDIYDFMDTLPRGAVGEFIRTAIHEKIQRDQQRRPPEPQPVIEPEPADTSASAAFEAIMQELADLRAAVAVGPPSESPGRSQRGVTVASGIDTGAAPKTRVTESPGIDTSGPPPPSGRQPRAPAPPPTLPELEPVNEADFVARFLGSVGSYGR